MDSFETSTTSPPSADSRIRTLLKEYRTEVFGYLDFTMLDTFEDIGKVLLSSEVDYTHHTISGLSPSTLQQIKMHAEAQDLENWLLSCPPGEKAQLLQDFLNTGKLHMDAIRGRYPRAFQKWTEEEDKSLLEAYHNRADIGLPILWGDFSERFGRNPNALKIRLERLGETLPPGESAQPGRFSR